MQYIFVLYCYVYTIENDNSAKSKNNLQIVLSADEIKRKKVRRVYSTLDNYCAM